MGERRKPRFYTSGTLGEYQIRERATPYADTGVPIITVDQYHRALIIARALNHDDGWTRRLSQERKAK